MNKIEELVEWVAKWLYTHDIGDGDEDGQLWIENYETFHYRAKQILSHPDLALIDEDQSYPNMVFYCEDCDKMVKNTKCNIVEDNWRKVIPLAEALADTNANSVVRRYNP